MKRNAEKVLICQACRSEFSCSAGGGSCWCFKVEIAPPVLRLIEKKYGDCLCPACLSKISTNFSEKDFTADADSL